MNNLLHKVVISNLLPVFLFCSVVGAGEINTGSRGSVAIKGYDPVAYFTEQRAVMGELTISHEWLGAIWRFSNEKHKTLFTRDPVKYAPQYGGYCADGVTYGVLVTDIDPEAWRIINGKLYSECGRGVGRRTRGSRGTAGKIGRQLAKTSRQIAAKFRVTFRVLFAYPGSGC